MYNYPIIDLHATWLVINPIQGCPNRCKYCFLNGVGLTGMKPVELVAPEEAVSILKESNLYDESIPLCIESQSDAFATPANLKYIEKLLEELDNNSIMNPKIFITKCKIPETFIKKIQEYKEKGHKFIFFLSYSGLSNDIEVGIDRQKIKENFILLSKYGMDIVHYWRPFIPQNSYVEKIMEVSEFVKKYAKCSVAIGMKVQNTFIDKIDFWPELIENANVVSAESVWSKEAYEYIWGENKIIDTNYPVFQTTSCAIAYVLGTCDRNAFCDSEICKKYNRCPDSQRSICKRYYSNINEVSEEYIYKLLDKLNVNYNKEKIKLTIIPEERVIRIIGIELTMKGFTYLTQMTRYKIDAKKRDKDYYWNTSVNNAEKIFL